MLALAISLLFAFAALAAALVIRASVVRGALRARQILAELDARTMPVVTLEWRPMRAPQRQLVAA